MIISDGKSIKFLDGYAQNMIKTLLFKPSQA